MKILSIIIPAYNAEKYIEKCLDSMIYSKYIIDKCELIVVNDGSTDRTSEIAHIYEKKYKNITVT